MATTAKTHQPIQVHAHGTVYEQTTTRQVTHAVVSINHRGEGVVVLTRSPKSAAASASAYGDTQIRVLPIVEGVAR
jgi:hypothetical protein